MFRSGHGSATCSGKESLKKEMRSSRHTDSAHKMDLPMTQHKESRGFGGLLTSLPLCTTHIGRTSVTVTILKKSQGCREGSADKGKSLLVCRPNGLSSVPGTHMVKEKRIPVSYPLFST